VSSNKMYVEK
jgi:hypothetical protein